MAESWDRVVDVVVVGTGGAALTAATLAHDGGAEVLIVEKMPMLGGTTAVSGGGVWLPNNHVMKEAGVEDSKEEALAYTRRVCGGREPDPELLEVYIDTAPEVLRYLVDNTPLSVHIQPLPDYYWPWHFPGTKMQPGRTVEAEGGEGGAPGQRVDVLAGQGVEDDGGAPGAEAEVGGADAVGVAFGVLDVDGAGHGGVEGQAVVLVDAEAAGGVAPQVGVERGEQGFDGAFAVAGGQDDGVGGEAGLGALLDVFEVEFDAVGAHASRGADGDAGAEGDVGPLWLVGAGCQSALVQLFVDGGDGREVDALVELPLLGEEAFADGVGQAAEVAGVVGGEVFQAEFAVLHGGEGLGAADPGEAFAAGWAAAEQVEEDLGAGLS